MVQALNDRWAALIVYLLVTTGSAVVVVKLSSIVADEAMSLAQPYLDNRAPQAIADPTTAYRRNTGHSATG